MTTTRTAIEVTDLAVRYGPVAALDGIGFEVPAGTVTCLLGPNGAGKTTAVRVLSTLERPSSGSARIHGHDVARSPGAVRRLISAVGQQTTLDDQLTGRDNLRLSARLWGYRRAAAVERADAWLALTGLGGAADRRVRTYSGGMRRRLDLAAGLIGEPAVIFLDEPAVGLDPIGRRTVWRLIEDRVAAGAAVLLTTQQLDEAEQLSDQVCLLDRGRVVAAGTPAQLIAALPSDRIEVVISEPGRVADAAAAVGRLTGRTVESVPEQSSIAVTVPQGPQRIPALIGCLLAEDIGVAELNLRPPSLTDVFLARAGTSRGGAR